MNNLFLEEFYEEINTNDYFDTVFTESVFNPMGKWIKKLKEIKNTKPDEFSDDIEIKQFVDKEYDDIIKSSKLLEKDVSNLSKKEILYMCGAVCGYLGGFVIFVASGSLGLGIVGAILSFALAIISVILEFVNYYSDNRCAKELRKIKSSLIKVQNKKGLDENTKKKISRMITSITDAEAEYTSRMKVEESAEVYDRIFEVLQENVDSGVITVEDAEIVNDLAYAKYMCESKKDDDEVSEEKKKALKKKITKTLAIASTAIATAVILNKICKKINNKKMEKEILESQETIKKLVPELKKYLNKDSINIDEFQKVVEINDDISNSVNKIVDWKEKVHKITKEQHLENKIKITRTKFTNIDQLTNKL